MNLSGDLAGNSDPMHLNDSLTNLEFETVSAQLDLQVQHLSRLPDPFYLVLQKKRSWAFSLDSLEKLEARDGIEPTYTALQAAA